jgi:hypothetical protein
MNNSAAVRVIAADRITGLVTLSASRPVERETTEQHERCRSQCAGSGDRDTSSTTMKPNVMRKEPAAAYSIQRTISASWNACL